MGNVAKQYRVIGPPGTGKTTFLVRQVERAVEAYGAMAVRVISFTRAAAKVVTGRLDVSDDNVGTLHHFGNLAIQRHQTVRGVADSPAGIKAWNAFCGRSEFMLGEKAAVSLDEVTGDVGTGSGIGDVMFRGIGALRSVHGSGCVNYLRPLEKAFYERWKEFKDRTEMVDFADMVELPLDLGLPFPGDPMCIFVDEAQDFTRVQWQLVRHWGEKASKFVTVGDPDQILYGWCGVDVKDFYDPPDAQEIVLSQSFRVPQEVHKLAMDWIRQTPGRVDVEYKPTKEIGCVTVGHPNYKEAGKLVAEVSQCDGTCAILVSARYMLDGIIAELKSFGIPFHNPYRPTEKGWNPTQGKAFDAIRSFTRLTEGQPLSWLDIEAYCAFLDSEKCNFAHGFKAMVKSMAGGLDGDKPAFTDPDEMVRYLSAEPWADRETLISMAIGDVDWLMENCLDSKKSQIAYPVSVYRKFGANPDIRVIVGNIHSVKGGEADVVYLCPDLSWSAFSAWEQAGSEADEIRRVFYVGMTRAKKSLRIMNNATRMAVRL